MTCQQWSGIKLGMSLLVEDTGIFFCSCRGHIPSCYLLCSNPSSATKSYMWQFLLSSIIWGVQLLDIHSEIWWCWAWVDCPRGCRSFLSRVLDHPSLAICCCMILIWCCVPSGIGWPNHLSWCSCGHVQGVDELGFSPNPYSSLFLFISVNSSQFPFMQAFAFSWSLLWLYIFTGVWLCDLSLF